MVGYKISDETRYKMSLAKLGRKQPKELIEKRVLSRAWYRPSNETKLKMSLAAIGRSKPKEEKSWSWKGDKVGHHGIHKWVQRNLGKPTSCSKCKTRTAKKFEWANVDHKYRRILKDWIRLCTKCHRKYDYQRKIKI